jgi:hypothetical protein
LKVPQGAIASFFNLGEKRNWIQVAMQDRRIRHAGNWPTKHERIITNFRIYIRLVRGALGRRFKIIDGLRKRDGSMGRILKIMPD